MKDSLMRLNHAKCDICGADPEIIYDLPTIFAGRWGHLCEKCIPTNAQDPTLSSPLGTRHKNRPVTIVEKFDTGSFDLWRDAVEKSFERVTDLDIESTIGDWPSRMLFDEGMGVTEAMHHVMDLCRDEWGAYFLDAIGEKDA